MNKPFSFDWTEFQPSALEEFRRLASSDPQEDQVYLGCVRVGDLCFDLCVWYVNGDIDFGFDLYVGGVDDGYGYSSREAMKTGKYASKQEVPTEEQYPYTHFAGAGFSNPQICWFADYDKFVNYANNTFTEFIIEEDQHTGLDLIGKARQPLRRW